MFLSVLAVFCLYICERVHCVSLINLDDYSSYHPHLQSHKFAGHNRQASHHLSAESLFAAPTRTATIVRSQPHSIVSPPKTRKAFIDRTFYPQIAPSTIEDLLSKEKEAASENSIYYNPREDNFISSSFDYGNQPVLQSFYPHSSQSIGGQAEQAASTSTSTSSPLYMDDLSSSNNNNNDIEKIELHTNNHQPMSAATIYNLTGSGSFYNPKPFQHNNIYQSAGSINKHSHMATPSIYGAKYGTPSASLANAFANNINLNYIHNLLSSKPLGSNAFASLLNFNLNSLPSSAYNSVPSSSSVGNNNKYMTPYHSTPVPPATSSQPPVTVASTTQPPTPQPTPVTTTAARQLEHQLLTSSNPTRLAPIDYSGSYGSCGRQQISVREPRIVGGNSTYEGEFPWAVNIQKQGNHHCGGVIVGRRWILTAAHCVRSQLVSNLVVRTGGHSLTRSINHITSHLSRDYLVDQIVMHDDFSRYDNLTASQVKLSANTNNADIALLRLKNDIMWNELAWPVCFPNRDSGNFSGHDAVVVGWGKLSEKSEDFSNDLQKVKLTIIDNNLCQSWFRQAGRDIPIDDRIICAGFKNGGKDACHGDSGGPLLSKIGGQYVVVGVVSTGIGCARPLLPGLYSRVTSYISWIEKYVV